MKITASQARKLAQESEDKIRAKDTIEDIETRIKINAEEGIRMMEVEFQVRKDQGDQSPIMRAVLDALHASGFQTKIVREVKKKLTQAGVDWENPITAKTIRITW